MAPETTFAYPRSWQPVVIEGRALPDLLGGGIEDIALLRCGGSTCDAIPFQVDERDPAGRWALEEGPSPTPDDSPGLVDGDDVLLFLAEDAGPRAPALARRLGARVEIEVVDPLGFPSRWVYAAVVDGGAPRSPVRYVTYDPAADRLVGRITLGYRDGIPQLLALTPGGDNVLDRLKIRALATFLWGLIRVGRSEADLVPDAVAWRAGPIRVLRRQALQIRMRFGIRSPRFTATTYFYRDFSELPLSIRLRVPPRYLFTSIRVQGGLDFHRLPGEWSVRLPGLAEALPAGCRQGGPTLRRDGIAGDWFALEGERLRIVQRLHRGPTLRSVRQWAWYRNGAVDDPPENEPGQCPGVGFTLDDWDGVEGGVHTLTSTSWVTDRDADLGVFLATVDAPLAVIVRPMAASPGEVPEARGAPAPLP
jgi:hypothetical protein